MTEQERQKIEQYRKKQADRLTARRIKGSEYMAKHNLTPDDIRAFVGAFIESQENGNPLDEYDMHARIGRIEISDKDILSWT